MHLILMPNINFLNYGKLVGNLFITSEECYVIEYLRSSSGVIPVYFV
jgi:hypothetical protein